MAGGFGGTQRDRERFEKLEKDREASKKRFEDAKRDAEKSGQVALRQFGAGSAEAFDNAFKNETVGLVTREEFASKKASVDERIAAEKKRGARAATLSADQVRAAEERAKRARAEQRAKLSFGDEEEEDDEDDEDDGGSPGGFGPRTGTRAPGSSRERESPIMAGGTHAGSLGDEETATSTGDARRTSPRSVGEASPGSGSGDGAVGGASGARDAVPGGAPESSTPGAETSLGRDAGGAGAAEAPLDGGAAVPTTAVSAPAPSRPGGAGPVLRIGKDPTVRADFLPDRDRDAAEAALREELAREWTAAQAALRAEPLEITYSFWNGSGHRRTAVVTKGDTVGRFLSIALEALRPHFRELKAVDVPGLMYVKEDVILPQSVTFYELIVNRAQGRSGPLFTFDLRQHAAIAFDPRQRAKDSHAGKVVERHWYSRNKHIYPASRWKAYDPETHVGADDEK